MAVRYYDDVLVKKLQRWIPEASKLRILKPDESKKLFELTADDNKDRAMKLPLLGLSRSDSLELLSTVKSPKSYDGLRLLSAQEAQLVNMSDLKGTDFVKAVRNIPEGIYQFNVIPIKLEYQLDIYTKTAEEGDEYLRNFLFKLINNPVIHIQIPYNNTFIEHIANIRVLSPVSNTSAISERLFSGQFTRWSIQLEIQDAFLFSVPYRHTWRLVYEEDGSFEELGNITSINTLEVSDAINQVGELEN